MDFNKQNQKIIKVWHFLTGFFLLVILTFVIYEYYKYKAHQTFLKEQFENYGDGRFLNTLSKMSDRQIDDLYGLVYVEDCDDFVFFVTGRDGNNSEVGYLKLDFQGKVMKLCSG